MSAQPYWRAIQSETEANLAKIIQQSLDEGDFAGGLVRRIRKELASSARKRAKKIARTETTMALNAGHEEAREELVAAGLVSGKQWVAITDRDVRAEHSALHNEVVAPRADFFVGDSPAQYPGHWSLPVSSGLTVDARR